MQPQPPRISEDFGAWHDKVIQSSDGRTVIERVLLIDCGQYVPILSQKTIWMGVGNMPIPGPQGRPVLHQFVFEINGAGDLIEAFALMVEQVEAAGKIEFERLRDHQLKQHLSGATHGG